MLRQAVFTSRENAQGTDIVWEELEYAMNVFVNVFLYNYSFLFLSSSSLTGYFLFELKVHYLVIDRGSIVNLFCSL